MISPELLRRFPLFGVLDDSELKAVAMLSEEEAVAPGTVLIEERQPADALFILIEGSLDLYFSVPEAHKEFMVGEINPGEPFGVSALIEPYIYTSTGKAATPSRLIRIDAAGLRELCQMDARLAYKLVHQVVRVTLERLNYARVQLGAAWA